MGPAAAAEIAAAAQRRLGELSWQDLAPADAQKRPPTVARTLQAASAQRQRVSEQRRGGGRARAAPTGNELGARRRAARSAAAQTRAGASQPRSTGVAAMHSAAALASLATAVPGTTQPMIMTAGRERARPGGARRRRRRRRGCAGRRPSRTLRPPTVRPTVRPGARGPTGRPDRRRFPGRRGGDQRAVGAAERARAPRAAGAARGRSRRRPHRRGGDGGAGEATRQRTRATPRAPARRRWWRWRAVRRRRRRWGGGGAEGPAWLPEEDALIVDAVRRVGFQWRAIAALLGVRSDGETRRRFSAIHQAGAKLCAPAGGPAADGSPMAPPVDPTTGGVAGATATTAAAPLAPPPLPSPPACRWWSAPPATIPAARRL